MKKLELHEMENVQGDGFIDGACAVVGFTGGGLAVRALVGMAVNPALGTAIDLAGAACFVYSIG
jgi:hypothetical protein